MGFFWDGRRFLYGHESSQHKVMGILNFDCPHCGGIVSIQEEARFAPVQCPVCARRFTPGDSSKPGISGDPTKPASGPAPSIILINCAACGTQVSPQAKSCPRCGHPTSPFSNQVLADNRQRGGAIASMVLGILSLLCLGIFAGISCNCHGIYGLQSRTEFPFPVCRWWHGGGRGCDGRHQRSDQPNHDHFAVAHHSRPNCRIKSS